MMDATCDYVNPYTSRFPSAPTNKRITMQEEDSKPQVVAAHSIGNMYPNPVSASTTSSMLGPKAPMQGSPPKVQTQVQPHQYPPPTSSTGSGSPNSNLSASVSPRIFPSSLSSSPPTQNVDLGSSYTWNPYTRTQFPYTQYATPDYYGNMGISAGPAWFPHHQAWTSNSYGFGNAFDDIAFQTQLQRRSVRCTCPNCTNEMSGLPPIVGPDERGRKQHICHIPGCERLYGKASHLKTHLRWHTGERPFLCLTCGKRFSRSDELQRHGRTHTNYRPYSCPICSKKFSRSDHLSKHKKTHFKDKKSKKAISAEDKNTLKKPDDDVSVPTVQKPASSNSDPLPQTPLKTELNSVASPPDVPSGYNPYQGFYQSSALFPQHQQAGDMSIQSSYQQANPSSYYPPMNVGEVSSVPSYAAFSHMQYDPLQAMSQSAASYPVKNDAYSSYIGTGMMAASTTSSANYPASIHHPWNSNSYQN